MRPFVGRDTRESAADDKKTGPPRTDTGEPGNKRLEYYNCPLPSGLTALTTTLVRTLGSRAFSVGGRESRRRRVLRSALFPPRVAPDSVGRGRNRTDRSRRKRRPTRKGSPSIRGPRVSPLMRSSAPRLFATARRTPLPPQCPLGLIFRESDTLLNERAFGSILATRATLRRGRRPPDPSSSAFGHVLVFTLLSHFIHGLPLCRPFCPIPSRRFAS